MKEECKNEDILNMAKSLLNNSEDIIQNFYIKQDLEHFIMDFEVYGQDTDFQDVLQVITRICLDDYDITDMGFQLEEIPHECVYCFRNDKDMWFDVYLHKFDNDSTDVTVGYCGDDSCTHDTDTIKQAIDNYFFLNNK